MENVKKERGAVDAVWESQKYELCGGKTGGRGKGIGWPFSLPVRKVPLRGDNYGTYISPSGHDRP